MLGSDSDCRRIALAPRSVDDGVSVIDSGAGFNSFGRGGRSREQINTDTSRFSELCMIQLWRKRRFDDF